MRPWGTSTREITTVIFISARCTHDGGRFPHRHKEPEPPEPSAEWGKGGVGNGDPIVGEWPPRYGAFRKADLPQGPAAAEAGGEAAKAAAKAGAGAAAEAMAGAMEAAGAALGSVGVGAGVDWVDGGHFYIGRRALCHTMA